MSTAVDHAYAAIRDEILSGRLQPGAHLREEELTRRIGVSRTPVREALRRLESDGYAIVEANRGAFVALLTQKDIVEILDLGLLIEGYAARLAASRITPDQIAAMRSLRDRVAALDAEEEHSRGDDSGARHRERAECVWAFHEIVLAASGNTRLMAIVAQLARTIISTQTFARYTPSDRKRLAECRGQILDALANGDADKAEAAIAAHVGTLREILVTRGGAGKAT
jgi:DNA-binding GntR family transcriptional regulator